MKNKLQSLSEGTKRLIFALLISLPLILFVGILIGFFKRFSGIESGVLLVGLVSAFVFRRIVKGFDMKIALASIFVAFIGLIVVELVYNFGVEGIFVFRNYTSLFNFVVQEDITRLSWSVPRLLSLLIAYSYARVV